MAAYLDASAIVKLVIAEPESPALTRFLRRHSVRVTSALSTVEVLRAVRSAGESAKLRARRVLERLHRIRIDDELLAAAGELDPVVLRSLDAIHVASAAAVGDDLTVVVTYDTRMLAALAGVELAARAPGAPYDRALRATRRPRPRPRTKAARRPR